MLIQKKVTKAGVYLKKKAYEYEGQKFEADVKHGDTVKILDAGEMVEGQYGPQHVFSVSTRNGDRITPFNQTTLNVLVDAFGGNSEQWKGKEVTAHMIKAMVSGKLQNVLYLAPQGWEMNDDGKFFNPSQGSSSDGIDYPTEDINPDDIPY